MEPKPALLTPLEYLEREEKSLIKCEYVDGEVYAMAGANRRHNLIASNLVYRARDTAGYQSQRFRPEWLTAEPALTKRAQGSDAGPAPRPTRRR